MRGREQFAKYRMIINFFVSVSKILPQHVRKKLFEHYRTKKGKSGIVFRYILLKSIAKKCGDNVMVATDVYFKYPENLVLGENISFQPMCYIDAEGGIEIGDDVSIAHSVTILSSNHRFNQLDIAIKDQGMELLKTQIKNNVWIGAKATILAGSLLKSGTVLAANCVLTKKKLYEENLILAGIPARMIRKRYI